MISNGKNSIRPTSSSGQSVSWDAVTSYNLSTWKEITYLKFGVDCMETTGQEGREHNNQPPRLFEHRLILAFWKFSEI